MTSSEDILLALVRKAKRGKSDKEVEQEVRQFIKDMVKGHPGVQPVKGERYAGHLLKAGYHLPKALICED